MPFNFGNPNLFVHGVVDQMFFDPTSGDVIGYDKVATEAALTYAFDFTDITGLNDKVIGKIPKAAKITGTYTTNAFSLETRSHITGGTLSYDGIAPICETIVATGSTLRVSNAPVKALFQSSADTTCWCTVREKGATSYSGTNYGVDPTTKEVQTFTATTGATYEVSYFTNWVSAKQLGLPFSPNPNAVAIQQRFAVYAAQNASTTQGIRQGYLYVVIPLAILTGDAGMSANQSSNATTQYTWEALDSSGNMPACDSCDNNADNGAYYIYVPCGDEDKDVDALIIPGTEISVSVGDTVTVPVKYLMADDSLVQADYTKVTLSAESSTQATFTLASGCQVTGVSAGSGAASASYTKEDGTALQVSFTVTVVAAS